MPISMLQTSIFFYQKRTCQLFNLSEKIEFSFHVYLLLLHYIAPAIFLTDGLDGFDGFSDSHQKLCFHANSEVFTGRTVGDGFPLADGFRLSG